MKKMFKTKLGSEYFLNEDGTWIRKKYSGEDSGDYIYLGSIDPSKNRAFSDGFNSWNIILQIFSGKVEGFGPGFDIGHHPLGIRCKPGEICYKNNKIKGDMKLIKDERYVNVGHKITEIYDTL